MDYITACTIVQAVMTAEMSVCHISDPVALWISWPCFMYLIICIL